MQIDDAYLGDRAPGKRGKKGRGAANKIPFVIAVETHEGKPAHMQLRRVPGFTQKAL